MRVDSLVIHGLYGYMDLNLRFKPDLNFLIGINGSGKTSVLNILAWALTPSLVKLAQTDFQTITIGCLDDIQKKRTIEVRKTPQQVVIAVNDIPKKLEIPIFDYPSEPTFIERNVTSPSEMYDRFRMENRTHSVFVFLEELGPPLYLPLDRKSEIVGESKDIGIKWRTLLRHRPQPRSDNLVGSVLYLAEKYYRQCQTE